MKPKILLVAHGYPFEKIGGVGQVITQLIEQLPSMGWDVHVLVPEIVRWQRKPKIVSTTHTWGTLHKLYRHVHRWSQAWTDNAANSALQCWLSTLLPHTIHIHHLNGFPLQWLFNSSAHLHLTLHDYALPCSRGQLLDRNLHVCTGPTPIQCQTCIEPWLSLERHGKDKLEQRHKLSTQLLHSMDRIDAPSFDLIQRFQGFYPTLTIEHCSLPVPPIETDHLNNINSRNRSRHRTGHTFLFVGSIHPSKGVHLALQAFSRLSITAHLSIAGGKSPSDIQPNYFKNCKDFATQFQTISWLGQLKHTAVLNEMMHHDTLILPSIWPENSPVVIREALQRGMQVICGRGGSIELSDQIVQATPLSVSTLTSAMKQMSEQKPPQATIYHTPNKTVEHWIGSPSSIKPSMTDRE